MNGNKIYNFLKENQLTDKDEATFLEEYSNPEKSKELYKFFVDNQLTDKNYDEFYGEYLKKKEPTTPTFGQDVSQKLGLKPISFTTSQPSALAGIKSSPAPEKEQPKKQLSVVQVKPDIVPKDNTVLQQQRLSKVKQKEPQVGGLEAAGRNVLAGVNELFASALYTPEYLKRIFVTPILSTSGLTDEEIATYFELNETSPLNPASAANAIARYYKKDAEKLKEPLKGDYDKSVSELIAKGDYLEAAKVQGVQLAGSLPSTLGVAIMASTGLPVGGVTAAGSVLFGSQEYMQSEGAGMTETQRQTNSYLKGFSEYLFEQLGTGAITKYAKDIIVKEGKEKAVDIIKNQYVQALQTALKPYFPIVAPLQEGLTEAATTIAQNVVDKYTDPEKSDIDILQGSVDSFIAGATMGTAFGAVPTIVGSVRSIKSKKQAAEIQTKLDEIDSDLNNPQIPNETKDLLIEKRRDLVVEANELLAQDSQQVSELPVEQQVRVEEIGKEIEAIDASMQSDVVSETSKSALEQKKKELEAEFEAITTPQEEIVSETVSELEPPVVEQTTTDGGGVQSPDVSEAAPTVSGEVTPQETETTTKNQVEILDIETKIAQLEKDLRKAPLKPSKGKPSQKQIRTQISNYKDQLRELQGKPPRVKPKGSVLTRRISKFQSQVDQNNLPVKEKLFLDLIGRVSETDRDVQGMDAKQRANQKKKGVIVAKGESLDQIITDFINENGLDPDMAQELRDEAITFLSQRDVYDWMKEIEERESTPDPDAMRDNEYYNYGYDLAEEFDMTVEEMEMLESEVSEILLQEKQLTEEQHEELTKQFAEELESIRSEQETTSKSDDKTQSKGDSITEEELALFEQILDINDNTKLKTSKKSKIAEVLKDVRDADMIAYIAENIDDIRNQLKETVKLTKECKW